MNLNDSVYVAGHNGMVGSALVRTLKEKKYNDLILRTHDELDLTIQKDVINFFREESPDIVFLAAAKVGGINTKIENPTTFLMDNIIIQHTY